MLNASSIKKLRAMDKELKESEYFEAIKRKISPDVNSMSGYCIDIFVLQKAHFPLKNIHDMMGILCQGFSG
jgi:hypothetical protein